MSEEKRTNANFLINQGLEGFSVQVFAEVYKVDEDGKKVSTIGFLSDHDIAKAFCQNQTDISYYRIGTVLLLTDGKIGFVLGLRATEIMDNDEVVAKIKKKALAKLTPEERKILELPTD
jgi:hypothetical protein